MGAVLALVFRVVEYKIRERSPKAPLHVVVEPKIGLEYGEADGPRIKGSVTERWGTDPALVDRLSRKRTTPINLRYE